MQRCGDMPSLFFVTIASRTDPILSSQFYHLVIRELPHLPGRIPRSPGRFDLPLERPFGNRHAYSHNRIPRSFSWHWSPLGLLNDQFHGFDACVSLHVVAVADTQQAIACNCFVPRCPGRQVNFVFSALKSRLCLFVSLIIQSSIFTEEILDKFFLLRYFAFLTRTVSGTRSYRFSGVSSPKHAAKTLQKLAGSPVSLLYRNKLL